MMSIVRRFLINTPIIHKQILLFLITATIPILLISLYSYSVMRSQLIEKSYAYASESNQQISMYLDTYIDAYVHISSQLYTDAKLKYYLTMNHMSASDYEDAYDYINNLLYGYITANPFIVNIKLYVFNSSIPSDGLFIEQAEIASIPPIFHSILASQYGSISYSDAYFDSNNTFVFSLLRMLNYDNIRLPYALLSISIREDLIYSIIEKESIDRQVFVLNPSSSIIATKNKELIGRSIYNVLPYDSIRESENGIEYALSNNGGSHISKSISHYNWIVITVIPYTLILLDVNRSSSIVLLLIFLSLSLSLIAIFLASLFTKRRIDVLIYHINTFERNNFTAITESMGNDEIGQLSSSFNGMALRLNMLISNLTDVEIKRRDAEFAALQSQINPHFLYNALSGISSLALASNAIRISNMINHLSRYYQMTLNNGKPILTISNEIELTKHYLALQHMRFGNAFIDTWEIDRTLLSCITIKQTLQPFIENSIKYGISTSDEPLLITIRISCRDDLVEFEISDTGKGIHKDILQRLTRRDTTVGVGIYNVDERVKITFGQVYGINIRSAENEGTLITVTHPKVEDVPTLSNR